jgi:O-antigen/teichoic acid export membrane protein
MNLASTLTYNIIYRVLNMAAVYAIVVLLSKLAGVEGYGLLSLMIVNATVFNLVSAFGADAGITYHSSNAVLPPGKIITIIFTIVAIQLVAFGITELTCYRITGHYWIYKSYFAQYWWIGVLFLLGISITEKYTALFNGHHLFTRCSKLILVTNLLILSVFSTLFFYYPAHDVVFLITIYVLLYLFQSVVLVIVFHGSVKGSARFVSVSTPEIKIFLSFSVITLIANLVQFLAYRTDYWFIDHYRGAKELGWYSLSVRLAQVFWILPVLFAGILFPQVAKEKERYNNDKMLSFIRILFLLNVLAGVLSFFLIQWVIPVVFGKMYNESILPFQILLPGIILFCPATVMAAWFAGKGLLRINLWGSVTSFLSILLLDIFLIPSLGMNGAALASSIGYTVTSIYFMSVYCRQTNTPAYKLFYLQAGDWYSVRDAIYKTITKNA